MSRRSLAIVIAVVLAAAAMTGVSAAFWTGGGGGTGSAADATNLSGVTVIAVSVGDSPTSALLPGGSADVIVKVANTNGFPVTVTSIRRAQFNATNSPRRWTI